MSTDGLVSATFDDSPEDASLGVLFGFVGGDKARQFNTMAPSDRSGRVLAEFSALFGAEAGSPQRYFETNWTAEPWSRGCPVALYGPGTLTAYGPALRKPVDIHWAGTETSNYWNGYMGGAVRSGVRAANEVLAGEAGARACALVDDRRAGPVKAHGTPDASGYPTALCGTSPQSCSSR